MKFFAIFGCVLLMFQPLNAMQTRWSKNSRALYSVLATTAVCCGLGAYYVYKNYVSDSNNNDIEDKPDTTNFPVTITRTYYFPRSINRIVVDEAAIPRKGAMSLERIAEEKMPAVTFFIRAHNQQDAKKTALCTRADVCRGLYTIAPEAQQGVDVRIDYAFLIPENQEVRLQ